MTSFARRPLGDSPQPPPARKRARADSEDALSDDDESWPSPTTDTNSSSGGPLMMIGGAATPVVDDERRAHHNELERRRRDHIKDHFFALKRAVPLLDGEKSSRALILKRAAEYITLLSDRLTDSQGRLQALQRRNELLETQLLKATRDELAAPRGNGCSQSPGSSSSSISNNNGSALNHCTPPPPSALAIDAAAAATDTIQTTIATAETTPIRPTALNSCPIMLPPALCATTTVMTAPANHSSSSSPSSVVSQHNVSLPSPAILSAAGLPTPPASAGGAPPHLAIEHLLSALIQLNQRPPLPAVPGGQPPQFSAIAPSFAASNGVGGAGAAMSAFSLPSHKLLL